MRNISFGPLIFALSMVWAVNGAAAETAFVVIADPAAPGRRLSREVVARIFLRKQIYWEGGQLIQPVNLPVTHGLRREFSVAMLGGSPDSFEDYWRGMYFGGVLPPHVLESEEAVALFVASTPGAIGYLSSCPPGHRYTIVMIIGDVAGCSR